MAKEKNGVVTVGGITIRKPTDDERALSGPIDQKPPTEKSKHHVYVMRNTWRRNETAWEEWQRVLGNIIADRVWEFYPENKPCGSLPELLRINDIDPDEAFNKKQFDVRATISDQLQTKSEAAKIAAEQTTAPGKRAALEYIAEHPEATQKAVAEAAGITQQMVAKIDGCIYGTSSENTTQADRAKTNGITDRSQRKLDKIERERPDLFDRVRSGELSIYAANKQAGFQSKSFQLPTDPTAAGRYLAKRVDREWLMECVDAFMKASQE